MNLTSWLSSGPRRGGSRPVLAGWMLGAVLPAGILAGCAPAPELDRDAARQLQSQVLTVTEAAAANDPAAALQQLDGLALKLDEAAARGGVSFQRHQGIRAALESVRADLTAQQAAAARLAAEQEAAAQAAAAAAAQAEADAAAEAAAPPAVAPAPPSDKGKAKGKDNDDD